MCRSRSLYCHSNTGPTGSTALILRENIRSSLSRPFKLSFTALDYSQRHFGENYDSR
jgi:hypothetical protein